MKIAIYPGSFDPMTNGHLDIIERSLKIFGKLIVVIARNTMKDKELFSLEERINCVREVCKELKGVEVLSTNKLIADFFNQHKAQVLIRGLRTVSDFEYESAMERMNKYLNPNCETIFLMPSLKTSFVSSNILKEIILNKGDISSFVPSVVFTELKKKFFI